MPAKTNKNADSVKKYMSAKTDLNAHMTALKLKRLGRKANK